MSPEILAESSTRYARETTRAEWFWRIVAIGLIGTLLAMPFGAVADEPTPGTMINFDIPQQRADLALTQFAEQANLTLLFPFDGVRDRTANALTGEYTLDEAIEVLLAGTGLTPTFKNALVLDIAIDSDPTLDEDSMNTKKRAGVVAVLAGVLAGGVNAQEPTVTEAEIQTSVVTGTVTDARTGANLKGAKVTIKETSQWTSTGDLGRFRFSSVPEGEYTLRVSFLGYAEQSAVIAVQDGLQISETFALRGGSEIEEIVVFGTRSARALALNQERTAENAQIVISNDLLGNFTGTTISEALRRAPGIAFEQDFDTGDGTNIVVRGLAPDLNVVTFNGIELPESSGEGRSASLNNILTDSVEKVTVNTTLLPNQDSAGIGGLVEIETKSALDRPRRFAQFAIDGRQREDDFADDFLASAQLSGIFGEEEDIGLGMSLQYRDREIKSITGGVTSLSFGAYLPNDVNGDAVFRQADEVLPLSRFPFSDAPGARAVYPNNLLSNDTTTATETISLGLNGAWNIGSHTSLRLDYQLLDETRDSVFSLYSLLSNSGYRERPVVEVGGESRRALGGTSFRPLILLNNSISNDETQTTNILSFRGESVVDRWELSYDAAYTTGESETPERFGFNNFVFFAGWDASFVDPSRIDPTEGIVLSPFPAITPEDETIPLPVFTDEGLALINDPALYPFGSGALSESEGENDRISGSLSAKYNFDHEVLKYVEIGVDIEESEFFSRMSQSSVGATSFTARYPDFGLSLDREVLSEVGVNTGLFTLSTDSVRSLYNNLDGFAGQGLLVVNPIEAVERDIGVKSTETEIAPFMQARVDVGNWELIGGVRYSSYDIEADDLNSPGIIDVTGFRDIQFAESSTVRATRSATQNEWLPRLLINFRPKENWVFRGGYFKSIARPQLSQISDSRIFTLDLRDRFGPARDLPRLQIREGNPDLKPAETDNFDVSAEFYEDNVGAIKLSAFYKRIINLTELNSEEGLEVLDGLTLPDFTGVSLEFDAGGFDLSDSGIRSAAEQGLLVVDRRQPFNNDSEATIWGMSASIERQFTFLPGNWDGLGVYANYTYTDSEKDQPFSLRNRTTNEDETFVINGVRFDGQPEDSGTIALTYNKFDIDTALIYSFQDRRQTRFEVNGLSSYEEAYESLDFRFSYLLDDWGSGQYLITFEAVDLLRDADEATLLRGEGENNIYYTNRSFLGGREFRLRLTATF